MVYTYDTLVSIVYVYKRSCLYCSRKLELQNVFKRMDTDGNNGISFDEARDVLRDFKFSDGEIHSLMQHYDANHDGILQYDEFVHFWNACGGKVPANVPKK